MKPENQRIAIAKACGWRVIDVHEGKNLPPDIEAWTRGDGRCRFKNELPDYLNDLNAMHEAESVFGGDGEKWERWVRILASVTSADRTLEYGGVPKDVVFVHIIAHAKAKHRAEAFLKTLGLWQNED